MTPHRLCPASATPSRWLLTGCHLERLRSDLLPFAAAVWYNIATIRANSGDPHATARHQSRTGLSGAPLGARLDDGVRDPRRGAAERDFGAADGVSRLEPVDARGSRTSRGIEERLRGLFRPSSPARYGDLRHLPRLRSYR